MRRVESALGATALALVVAAIVVSLQAGVYSSAFGSLFYATVPIVGLIVARARPGNVVGWCFIVSPLLLGLEKCGETIAAEGVRRHWPDAVVHPAAWLSAWTWFPGLFVLVTVALLRFPDSTLLGPRWRWVERLSYGAMGLWIVGLGVSAASIPARELVSADTPDPTGVFRVLFLAAETMLFVVFVCTLASLASLILRYRRGGSVEREQIKWVLSAAVLAIAIELVLDIGGTVSGPWPGWTQTIGESVGFALIAVATGVAVTRYKLYEIERIVSRTVTYAFVLAVLAGIYAGVLVTLAALVPTRFGQVGVAAATLLVSVIAVPLTRRVRRFIDHRFNRSRFDAERVLAAFAARLRARPEQGDVPADLLEVLRRTVQPSHAGVWMVAAAGRATRADPPES